NEPVPDHPPLLLLYLKYLRLEKVLIRQREQMGHNDEIVLSRVRISTLEMIIDDIQVRHRSDMKSLLDKVRIMNMINDQDIEYTIPPTSPPDYPLMSYLSGRGMKPLKSESVPEKPNEPDAY
nr:hypothetical protein [Tanacetum cinerariifolium]